VTTHVKTTNTNHYLSIPTKGRLEGGLKKTMLQGPFAGFSSTPSPVIENRQASACYTERRKSKKDEKYVILSMVFFQSFFYGWKYLEPIPSPLSSKAVKNMSR
jgi:hypothetical protein